MLRSIRLLFLLTVLVMRDCLSLQPVAALAPLMAKAPPAAPYFLRTACLYRILPDANVTCGYLLVPEDRSQPTSKTIRLHVLIFKGSSRTPAADPLILLNGGPGSPGQPLIEAMLCYTRLRDEGINLGAYNLAESAADINDLRLALGYDQVNLYGFSYGSLLAAAVVRNDPTAIRSVVLDAVLPPGINLIQEKPHCLQSAFAALFAGCAADPACHAAYPELERPFYATLERLHGAPVTVPITALGQPYAVVVDDLKFLNHLLTQLQRGLLSPLPRQIEAAFGGNYEGPAKQWLAYAAAQATPASRLNAATAYGM